MLTPSEDLRAIIAIIRERNRQIAEEDWTPEHDDTHTGGELAIAAACYLLYGDDACHSDESPHEWPWDETWWKPKDQKRNLERAGALIIAELARIYREEEEDSDD